RRRWAQAHLDSALTRLPRAEWEIAHAPGWPDDERQAIAAWLAAHGGPGLLFEEDRTLAAGFRVRVGRNTLDATLQGLLADRKSIEGRLLQHLARETGEQS
ncbi:MAG: hypothetical protein L0H73_13740, partial [Nitrococcus sp.]|nr:hypothetical protein [Nitrococcus sp.]